MLRSFDDIGISAVSYARLCIWQALEALQAARVALQESPCTSANDTMQVVLDAAKLCIGGASGLEIEVAVAEEVLRMAIAAHSAGWHEPRDSKPSAPSYIDGENCCICMDGPKTHIMFPCGHQCICAGCAQSLQEDMAEGKRAACPLCRTDCVGVMKVFK